MEEELHHIQTKYSPTNFTSQYSTHTQKAGSYQKLQI
jgi:hypothetical protein